MQQSTRSRKKQVKLAYGTQGLLVDLPEGPRVSILRKDEEPAISAPEEVLRRMLEEPIGAKPLSEIANGRESACVAISDMTRPVPNCVLLPPILEMIEEAGVARERITILIGTGLHRPSPDNEVVELVGPAIAERYRIESHRGLVSEGLADCGETRSGIPIHLNRIYVAAQLKILTGLIEPHLLAGYSGGSKGLCPGLAGLETVRHLHGPRMLEANVGVGIVSENPFRAEIDEIADRVGIDFLVNVTLGSGRAITGLFAGEPKAAFHAGVRAVERSIRVDLAAAADVVLTSGGGYPLDRTFYQSVKGLVAALNIVKPGGSIVMAASLSEGIGSEPFERLLRETPSCETFMKQVLQPDFFRKDQWMVQHLCQVLRKAEVFCYTDGLGPDGLEGLLVNPVASVEEGLRRALDEAGEGAHLAVLPQGPYIVATLCGETRPLGAA